MFRGHLSPVLPDGRPASSSRERRPGVASHPERGRRSKRLAAAHPEKRWRPSRGVAAGAHGAAPTRRSAALGGPFTVAATLVDGRPTATSRLQGADVRQPAVWHSLRETRDMFGRRGPQGARLRRRDPALDSWSARSRPADYEISSRRTRPRILALGRPCRRSTSGTGTATLLESWAAARRDVDRPRRRIPSPRLGRRPRASCKGTSTLPRCSPPRGSGSGRRLRRRRAPRADAAPGHVSTRHGSFPQTDPDVSPLREHVPRPNGGDAPARALRISTIGPIAARLLLRRYGNLVGDVAASFRACNLASPRLSVNRKRQARPD